MPGATVPRVDPRARRTRKLLEHACLELLTERGFRAITVGDIAARAEVNRATFYAHFTDKNALMDCIIREKIRGALACAIPADAPFTLDNLRILVRMICEFFGNIQNARCRPGDQLHLEPLTEMAVQEELQVFITAWLKRLQHANAPTVATASIVASAMSWSIFGIGISWSRGGREQSADAVAWGLVDILADGVPRALGLN